MAGKSARPPGYWEGVEADYRGGMRLLDIYAKHGCTKGVFDGHRDRAGWPKRKKGQVNRAKLLERIFWLIDHHIEAMENNMTAGSHSDVAVLNQLVGSLGRLIRLEASATKPPSKRADTADLQDIRDKLVRRIEELKRS